MFHKNTSLAISLHHDWEVEMEIVMMSSICLETEMWHLSLVPIYQIPSSMWTTPWMTNTPFQVAWTWLKFTFHFMCLPSFLCWKSSICDFHSIWKYFMFLHSSWTNHRLPIHFYTTLRRGAPGDHGKKKRKKGRSHFSDPPLYWLWCKCCFCRSDIVHLA